MAENINTNPEVAADKKGSKKFLIIAIVAVLLLGGAGGGFYFWRASASSAETEPTKKKGGKKSEAKTDEDQGAKDDAKTDGPAKPDDALTSSLPSDDEVNAIVELPPFIVNLADTEQARYLRMSVSLGIEGEEGKNEKPDQLFITRVRNTLLAVLSDKKSEEILSVEGKAKLRKALLEAAQAASEEPKVQAIYITDFIVQL